VILDVPKYVQDEHEKAFSKDKMSRNSQGWVSLHKLLEASVEEGSFLRT